jgi:hypothetical protein
MLVDEHGHLGLVPQPGLGQDPDEVGRVTKTSMRPYWLRRITRRVTGQPPWRQRLDR